MCECFVATARDCLARLGHRSKVRVRSLNVDIHVCYTDYLRSGHQKRKLSFLDQEFPVKNLSRSISSEVSFIFEASSQAPRHALTGRPV